MIARFIRNSFGTAAAEFALTLPMMLALLFGAMEAGHFFWTQHKIVKSVRDGARFASRLDVTRLCANDAALLTEIRNVTATGQLVTGGTPKVPGWQPANVNVAVSCGSFVDTGIYSDLGERGPLVTVSSGAVRYPSILGGLGYIDSSINLSARSSAAVVGI
ncbi:TadE/TadG family type IV pilus assembly protein [Erythrobacter sp. sf7]|uniref:TadE/TadG family type IV pilus assembly protein n=1 Tax=Erythrobacter fulvus TaxID=2987523 RepID=A0ABT5JRK9_9SPHN|nr:TadE/TadG family type IV pilus assembly protein [Erythrobacter fulvus]MDC8754810.1 TadE/TadG family type IV pilus assembly protein [Erythrobacter fulvus]